MELKEFPYRTTNRLVKYSKLITKAIASFNWSYAFKEGKITHDPRYGIPRNEDRLDYWDEKSKDITFGRYLLFTPIKGNNEDNGGKKNTPFWTGISSTYTEIIFCIWFKESDVPNYTVIFEEFIVI